MGIFSKSVIALDLGTEVNFKKKLSLKKAVTDNGGTVSYIVTKQCTLLVLSNPEKADVSYKCKMATKYKIPVVNMEFIHNSVEKGKLLDPDAFLACGMTKAQEFSSGKIVATQAVKQTKKSKVSFNLKGVHTWKPGEKNMPLFDENKFEIAKYAIFKKFQKRQEIDLFYILEIHVSDAPSSDEGSRFRIHSHHGSLRDVKEGKPGVTEYRFTNSSDEALAIYAALYKEQTDHPKGMTVVNRPPSRHIGSHKFRKVISELGLAFEPLSPCVRDLVEHIWREASGELSDILSQHVSEFKLEQVEKAEALLLQIKTAVDAADGDVGKLLKDYQSTLPQRWAVSEKDVNKHWLGRQQDLCQLIKDIVSVSEATNWSTRESTESKYRALRCHIQDMRNDDTEYKMIKELFHDSEQQASIQNIYEVHRQIETDSFRKDLEEKKYLFHSSRVDNFVGILSRGLLLPKLVVDDYGGKRSDPGMLGSGIYFASDSSTSVKYSHPSKTKGTRLMLVNEVALGQCQDYYKYNTELTGPPDGYDSVHGVKSDAASDFQDDEYVIYSTNQQRIRFLIEFTVQDDEVRSLDVSPETVADEQDDINEVVVISDLKDVQNIEDPLSKVQPGLVSTSDNAVELKGVHIRAKLIDLAAQVVVLQEYYNRSDAPIEAKYVFPLDDMAAVCGFEAFINGKHIIGEVKEKETAHKEYKQAISEGHGAYLMDQDEESPDVFTVSVGNLPPNACVLIKITYATELQVEGEVISFRLPGSVAPWRKDASSKDKTQVELETIKVEEGSTSIQVTVEMPFDIRTLECPTHKIRIKKTATNAVIKLLENQTITDGFQLLIGLAEIHVPRMWVENNPAKEEERAVMLTFYPEFEASEDSESEIVLLLDLSNSMKGKSVEEAKKLGLLALHHLPKNSWFNIVVFGTGYHELFPCSKSKTATTVKAAKLFIMNMCADMGSTDVYHPLHSFFLLSPESSLRNVFLISDGHINNDEMVLSAIYRNARQTRLFTLGVGSTSNRHLLRALARVGAGYFEFFDSKAKSKWETRVISQISKAVQPGLTSVAVDWEQYEELPPPIQAPSKIMSLFNGSRQVIYGFVPNCNMATLKAEIGGHEVSTVVSTSDLNITFGNLLHQLTARAVIRDWEDGMLHADRTNHEVLKMKRKEQIIELSKTYSIVTQFTSFIAVEKRDKDDELSGVVPSIDDLVEGETYDILEYITWDGVDVMMHEGYSDGSSESEHGSSSSESAWLEVDEGLYEYSKDDDEDSSKDSDSEIGYKEPDTNDITLFRELHTVEKRPKKKSDDNICRYDSAAAGDISMIHANIPVSNVCDEFDLEADIYENVCFDEPTVITETQHSVKTTIVDSLSTVDMETHWAEELVDTGEEYTDPCVKSEAFHSSMAAVPEMRKSSKLKYKKNYASIEKVTVAQVLGMAAPVSAEREEASVLNLFSDSPERALSHGARLPSVGTSLFSQNAESVTGIPVEQGAPIFGVGYNASAIPVEQTTPIFGMGYNASAIPVAQTAPIFGVGYNASTAKGPFGDAGTTGERFGQYVSHGFAFGGTAMLKPAVPPPQFAFGSSDHSGDATYQPPIFSPREPFGQHASQGFPLMREGADASPVPPTQGMFGSSDHSGDDIIPQSSFSHAKIFDEAFGQAPSMSGSPFGQADPWLGGSGFAQALSGHGLFGRVSSGAVSVEQPVANTESMSRAFGGPVPSDTEKTSKDVGGSDPRPRLGLNGSQVPVSDLATEGKRGFGRGTTGDLNMLEQLYGTGQPQSIGKEDSWPVQEQQPLKNEGRGLLKYLMNTPQSLVQESYPAGLIAGRMTVPEEPSPVKPLSKKTSISKPMSTQPMQTDESSQEALPPSYMLQRGFLASQTVSSIKGMQQVASPPAFRAKGRFVATQQAPSPPKALGPPVVTSQQVAPPPAPRVSSPARATQQQAGPPPPPAPRVSSPARATQQLVAPQLAGGAASLREYRRIQRSRKVEGKRAPEPPPPAPRVVTSQQAPPPASRVSGPPVVTPQQAAPPLPPTPSVSGPPVVTSQQAAPPPPPTPSVSSPARATQQQAAPPLPRAGGAPSGGVASEGWSLRMPSSSYSTKVEAKRVPEPLEDLGVSYMSVDATRPTPVRSLTGVFKEDLTFGIKTASALIDETPTDYSSRRFASDTRHARALDDGGDKRKQGAYTRQTARISIPDQPPEEKEEEDEIVLSHDAAPVSRWTLDSARGTTELSTELSDIAYKTSGKGKVSGTRTKQTARKSTGGMARHLLSGEVDLDGSGYIAKSELGEVLQTSDISLPAHKERDIISEFDINKDKISLEEFEPLNTDLKAKLDLKFKRQVKYSKNIYTHPGMRLISNEGTTHTDRTIEEQVAFTNWINRSLEDDPDCTKYLPLSHEGSDLYEKCRDGIILCKMVNKSCPDTINECTINKSNLTIFKQKENRVLALKSAQSIGCNIINIGADDLNKPHILLELLWQIIRIGLIATMNLLHNPDLVNLMEEGETIEDLLRLSPEAILICWVNYHLRNAGIKKRVSNFTSDIMDSEAYIHLLGQIAPKEAEVWTGCVNETNPEQRAEYMLREANKIDCSSFVTPKDVTGGNFKLNFAFVANLFKQCPALEQVEACPSYPAEKLAVELGIGSKVTPVVRGSSPLEVSNLQEIYKLQEKDGHWSFSYNLDQLLGIKGSECCQLMEDAGLNSLGSRIAACILDLLATAMVLMRILYTILPEPFPIDLRPDKFDSFIKEMEDDFFQKLRKQDMHFLDMSDNILMGLEFCQRIDSDYPLVYSSLELGSSWPAVVAKMLAINV